MDEDRQRRSTSSVPSPSSKLRHNADVIRLIHKVRIVRSKARTPRARTPYFSRSHAARAPPRLSHAGAWCTSDLPSVRSTDYNAVSKSVPQ